MRTLAVSKLSAAALLGLLALLVSAACGSDSPQGADYGPLAVVDGVGDPLIASEDSGTIHIGERCATVTMSSGEERLLVWMAATVRWDKENRQITYARDGFGARDAELMTIRDGDAVLIRGSQTGSDLWEGKKYVRAPSTPNPECSGAWWLVYEVKKP